MSVQFNEIFFDDNSLNLNKGISYLNNKILSCNYLPDNSNNLTMILDNFNLTEKSEINFDILFNNQYPMIDMSYQFIKYTYINGINVSMKFNIIDLNINLKYKSHYIFQEFIINRIDATQYNIFSNVTKIPNNILNDNPVINILTVKNLLNKTGFYYDIDYDNYYSNIGEIITDPQGDRKYVDISFSSQYENDITDFDKFIVNLYNKDGDLVDTSGNENDPSNNTISKSGKLENGNNFRISDLILSLEYTLRIYPVIINTPSQPEKSFLFNLNDFFKLTEIKIITFDINNDNVNVSDIINFIGYKYLPDNIEYSSVDLTQGVQLETTDYEHKLLITTPNIYKCFKIEINENYLNNIQSIKLIGPKIILQT